MQAHPHSAPVLHTRLTDNVAGALAYITIVPAIAFLLLEPYRKRPFVRYNALQCIVLVLAAAVCSFVLYIPLLGIIAVPFDMVLVVLWLLCTWNAYHGRIFRLPIIASHVEELSHV